jgi:cytidylate kinase
MYPRFIEPGIREALKDTRVVAVAGPRQSGKSTLVRAIAGERAWFLSLDEDVMRRAAADDPTGFIRRAKGMNSVNCRSLRLAASCCSTSSVNSTDVPRSSSPPTSRSVSGRRCSAMQR